MKALWNTQDPIYQDYVREILLYEVEEQKLDTAYSEEAPARLAALYAALDLLTAGMSNDEF